MRLGGGRSATIAGALTAAVLVATCGGGPTTTAPSASPAAGSTSPAARSASPPAPSGSSSAAEATHSAPPVLWSHLARGEPLYGGAFEGPFDEITAGVAYDDGFVLVGRSIGADDAWRGVVWTSGDGTHWTRAVDGGAGFDRMYIPSIATDGQRLVALGWGVPWGNSRHGPYVAWLSDDGVTWQRHDEVNSTALGSIDVPEIIGSPSGFFAWGSQADGRMALLRSTDGLAWDEIAYPDADRSEIRRIAPYRGGFVAVGAEHNDRPGFVGGPGQAARAWWSPDGQQWSSVPVDGGWSLSGVYPTAAGVYAVGAPECSRCPGPRIAWYSVDGRSWSSPGQESRTYPFVATNGSQVAVFDWQGDRSVGLSDDGLTFHKAVANLPATEYDAGLIVGTTGVLLLVAKTPVVRGSQVVHSGVLFLRGS